MREHTPPSKYQVGDKIVMKSKSECRSSSTDDGYRYLSLEHSGTSCVITKADYYNRSFGQWVYTVKGLVEPSQDSEQGIIESEIRGLVSSLGTLPLSRSAQAAKSKVEIESKPESILPYRTKPRAKLNFDI